MEYEPQPHIEAELLAVARQYGVENNARALIEGVNAGQFAPEGLVMALEAISSELPGVTAQAQQFAESSAQGAINASEVLAAAPRIAAENPHPSLYEPIILEMINRQKPEEAKKEETRAKARSTGTAKPKERLQQEQRSEPKRPSEEAQPKRARRTEPALVDNAENLLVDEDSYFDETLDQQRKARTRQEVARMLLVLRGKKAEVERRMSVAAALDSRDATLQKLESAVEVAIKPLDKLDTVHSAGDEVVGSYLEPAGEQERKPYVSTPETELLDNETAYALSREELPTDRNTAAEKARAEDGAESETAPEQELLELIQAQNAEETYLTEAVPRIEAEIEEALSLVDTSARITVITAEERPVTSALLLQGSLEAGPRLRIVAGGIAEETSEAASLVVFNGENIRLQRISGGSDSQLSPPEYVLALQAEARDDEVQEETNVLDHLHQLPVSRIRNSDSDSGSDELGSPLRLVGDRAFRPGDDGADTLAIPEDTSADGWDRLFADPHLGHASADTVSALEEHWISAEDGAEGGDRPLDADPGSAMIEDQEYPKLPRVIFDDAPAPALATQREQRRIEQDEYTSRQIAAVS